METAEKVLEMGGMKRSDIVAYIVSIGGEDNGEGKYSGSGWEVEIGEEKQIARGSLRITSTRVLFRSEEERLEQLVSAFRLRFLSAGG